MPRDSFDLDPPYEPDEDDLPPDRFLDRELSWLRFNRRVLELAEDPDLPLLERTRFLAIFASNLDEFFMVRVAGLKRRLAAGVAVPAASGMMPREVLEAIWRESRELMERHGEHLAQRHRGRRSPTQGIAMLRWDELDIDEQKKMQELFTERVFPVLTPLAVDPAHPFPYISGLSLNLAVTIRNPDTGKEHFARVKVPPIFPRFVDLGEPAVRAARGRHRRTPRPALPRHGGVASTTPSASPATRTSRSRRTTPRTCSRRWRRSCSDAASARRSASRSRRRSTRTCSSCSCPSSTCPQHEVFQLPGPLDLTGLHDIADLDRPELKYPAFVPHTHSHLAEVESASPVDMFSALPRRDVLVHHPYDSFATSVQRFIEQAAADPQVLAIKQTLYRTSGDSPIIDALIDAAEAGKQVLVLVEIKARFDEQANIRWARKLEQAGCHVVYGLVGLKTHCKLALVVRDEGGTDPALRPHRHRQLQPQDRPHVRGPRPAHRRRGRHATTSPTCSTTCRGSPGSATTSTCFVAPESVRSGLLDAIEREIDHHRRPARRAHPVQAELAGRRGDDRRALPRLAGGRACRPVGARHLRAAAGRAGAVREHPGAQRARPVPRAQPGLLVRERWRAQAWIGSADLMHRNLDRRVEVLVRIPSRRARRRAGRTARPRLRRRQRLVVARPERRVDASPPRRRRRTAASTCRPR